jgi:Protein of unknown function (DUF664)
MLTDDLTTTLSRDLRALAREIAAYPDDAAVWREVPGLPNAAGVLARHLAGNIRHYVGTALGGGSFVRDRADEFAGRGATRAHIIAEVEAARADVERVLPALTDAVLDADLPVPVGGHAVGARRFLLHLGAHLAYHLGQIDYHRRVVAPGSGSVNAMAVEELG